TPDVCPRTCGNTQPPEWRRHMKHPFRVAIESGAGPRELATLFTPDAELYAPMLTKPVVGIEPLLEVVAHAARIAGPIRYTFEVKDSRQTFLFWSGQAGGFPLEAVTILVDSDDGRIRQMRVLMRSWPVVTLFRDA